MAAWIDYGTTTWSTATITVISSATATTPIDWLPVRYEPIIDFEARHIADRIRQRRRMEREASIARVLELCAEPRPRPVNHRIIGRDIRRLIPRRLHQILDATKKPALHTPAHP